MPTADLIPLSRALGELRDEWRELAERAAEPNPFHDPDYVEAAARHLGGRPPLVAVVAEDDRLLACMPVARSTWFRKAPVPNVSVWRHLYWGLGAPLVDPQRAEHALRALVAGLTAEAGTQRVVGLDWFPADGVLGTLFPGAAGPQRAARLFKTFERATLTLDGAAREWGGTLSRRRSRALRRQRTQLEREVGELRTVDRTAEPDALERFLRLEASGWKAARGTALLSRPAHADFFRAACRAFADRGLLQLLSLEAGASVIAMKCSVFSGGALFYLKAAYDEAFARFSPGVQLEVDTIPIVAAGGRATWIDSCTDQSNEMINRLFPGRRRLATWVIPPQGTLARAVVLGMMDVNERVRSWRGHGTEGDQA